MISRAIPYEGKEPYIFLSYCHHDAKCVYSLLEQMVGDGYRIWYDDGNHAGDDWLENIANHVNGCTVCLAMISEKSADSHNCRNEISFAIECNKKLIAVLLEDFRMPIGMRLQLGTIHYLKKNEYPSEYMLMKKLYETEALAACRAEPGSLPMRDVASIPSTKQPKQANQQKVVADFIASERRGGQNSDDAEIGAVGNSEETAPRKENAGQKNAPSVQKKFLKAQIKKKPVSDVSRQEPIAFEHKPVDTKAPVGTEPADPADQEDAETVFDDNYPGTETGEGDEAPTVWANQQNAMVLIRLLNGRAYILESALTRIGRSEKRCDVVIGDNPFIGNCHAEIIQYKNQYYLRDVGSINGTFVNGKRLAADEKVELKDAMAFQLYNESFVFVCDSLAEQMIANGCIYFLRSISTQGVKLLAEGSLLLDRSHKWEDGTLSDEKISRNEKHARITCQNNSLLLEDLGSRNGTFLNGYDIRGKGPQRVKETDQIRLGDTVLEVGLVTL